MLIPDIDADSSAWVLEPQSRVLSRADACFVAVDLPMSYPSNSSSSLQDPAEVAQLLARIPRSLGWEEFGVCGYSLGAVVALNVAATSDAVTFAAVGGVGMTAFARYATAASKSTTRLQGLDITFFATDDVMAEVHVLSDHLSRDISTVRRLAGTHATAVSSGEFAKQVTSARWGAGPVETDLPRSALMLAGFPGSGKSTAAHLLVKALGGDTTHLSSDAVRRELYPDARHYGAHEGRHTYEELTLRAINLLDSGRNVILDATFHTKSGTDPTFEQIERVVKKSGANVVRALLRADHEVNRQRVTDRGERSRPEWDKSEADLAVVERFIADRDAPKGFPELWTDRHDIESVVHMLRKLLADPTLAFDADSYLLTVDRLVCAGSTDLLVGGLRPRQLRARAAAGEFGHRDQCFGS
uniref:AAA family ATPase n=1 Tax=Gordonia bronchialis TaxID=2054 RepID=UPI002270947A